VLISVVVLGVLASLDPLRPAVFVLVLQTQFVNAIAFLAGWTLALSLLFVIVFVTFAGEISTGPDHSHRTAASVAEIAIGAALLVVAASRWRRRHEEGGRGGYPLAVVRRLGHVDVRRAAALGVLIQPRSLTIAAAVIVARDRSGVLSLLIGFVLFAVVSTAALLGILTYVVWRPESARPRLASVVSRLELQGPMIFTALCAAGGGYLVLDGLTDLML
jgi:Sap, sulfolipid-1-addressing protein